MNINKIYKKTQGKNTRLYTGLASFAILVTGCYSLFQKLQGQSIIVQTLVPVVICVGFSALIFWLMNKPAIADFLISAEGEIKKVSWTSWKEIVNSTLIVVFVVVLLAAGLGFIDLFFHWFFASVINLY